MEQHTDKRFNLDLVLERLRNGQADRFVLKTISHFYVLVFLGNNKYQIILNDGSIFNFAGCGLDIKTEYSIITYIPQNDKFRIFPFTKK